MVLRATHQDEHATLFWSIANTFYGKTSGDHKKEVLLEKGVYRLKVMDEFGNERMRTFEVLNDSK